MAPEVVAREGRIVFAEAVIGQVERPVGVAERRMRAGIGVRIRRAADAAEAGDIRGLDMIGNVVRHVRPYAPRIAIGLWRGIGQRRPEFLARARGLEEALNGRAGVLVIFARQVPLEAPEVPQRRDTRRLLVAGIIFGAAGDIGGTVDARHVGRLLVIDIAVMPIGNEGRAHREIVGNRDVDHPARAEAVVAAADRLDAGVETVELRLGGDQADRADGRVAAEQRALRAAQHFDALHVVHQHRCALRTRRIDAVDIDRDFGVGDFGIGGVVADTAQRQQDRALVALLREVQAWHVIGKPGHVANLLPVERRLAERGDRDRGLLEAGLALRRGHHDILELARIACRVRRLRGRRWSGGGRARLRRGIRLRVRGG